MLIQSSKTRLSAYGFSVPSWTATEVLMAEGHRSEKAAEELIKEAGNTPGGWAVYWALAAAVKRLNELETALADAQYEAMGGYYPPK